MASALVSLDPRSRYIPLMWAHLSPESVTLENSSLGRRRRKRFSSDDKRLLSLRGAPLCISCKLCEGKFELGETYGLV